MCYRVTIINDTVSYYFQVAKRVDLKSLHHKKKNFNYIW